MTNKGSFADAPTGNQADSSDVGGNGGWGEFRYLSLVFQAGQNLRIAWDKYADVYFQFAQRRRQRRAYIAQAASFIQWMNFWRNE